MDSQRLEIICLLSSSTHLGLGLHLEAEAELVAALVELGGVQVGGEGHRDPWGQANIEIFTQKF